MTFFGLYRGVVIDNDDSDQEVPYLGRIRVSVPQVYGDQADREDLPWAEPCLPMGGGQHNHISFGLVGLPPIGSTVWVQFEQGDPNRPVWMGTWYGQKDATIEMPEEARSDGDAGVSYPNIFLLKLPWLEDVFLRVSGDQRLEVVFGEDQHIRFDGTRKYLDMKTGQDWTIEVNAENGTLSLKGKSVVIESEENLNLLAGENLVGIAGEDSTIRAGGVNSLSAGERLDGNAPAVSGFETQNAS
jgi:hypothetical protein